MMVLCEADELRWRRNTQVEEDFADDPLETVTKSRTNSIQFDRETLLEKQYLTNHSYSNSRDNSMPAEMLLVKADEWLMKYSTYT